MNEDFLFFDASNYTSSLRCTIHRSGKIGFTDFTQKKLGMHESMSVKIGIDGQKDNFSHLLLQFLNTIDPRAFKVNKAGNYFYINPKPLLDELGLNYKQNNIIYDMIPLNAEARIYKLIKKEGKSQQQPQK